MESTLLLDSVIAARKLTRRLCGKEPNSALDPQTQNRDHPYYDWISRHEWLKTYCAKHQPNLVLLGDSITHRLGGTVQDKTPRTGQTVWDRHFAPRGAVNLGFGFDRTENVLWRLGHGALDQFNPKGVIVLIGTNNLLVNTVEDTVAGIYRVVDKVFEASPVSNVLLLGLLPRGFRPNDPLRLRTAAVNKSLERYQRDNVTTLNAGRDFVREDGQLDSNLVPDALHPSAQGYEQIVSEIESAIQPWFR